jgi:bacteriorhodopsin
MKKLIASLAVALPAVALAQPITDVNTLTYKLTNIGNTFIQILIAFAVIWIVYNVVQYIVKSQDPAARSEIGKSIMFSIIGLFVILSIWGLVRILTNTFRTDTTAPTDQFPQVQYPSRIP